MDMTKGNLWKQVLVFSLPLVFTNLLQLVFNLADVAIVGRFAGPISLGAVGSTSTLIALTTGWLIGVGNGVNSVVAFFAGAGETRNEQQAVHTGLWLCLGTGLLTFAAGFGGARFILTLLGTKPELIGEAIVYFKIYMIGSPALALFNFGNSVLSAEGDTKKPLKYLSIAGVLNIVLNLFFVLGLGMTSDGVAYASIISQYLSAVLIMRAVCTAQGPNQLQLNRQALTFHPGIARRIVGIGVPTAIQYSLFSVANLVIQAAVNTFDHVTVEGNSAAMGFDGVVYQMMDAFYVANTSFIAQNYGAGNRSRVIKTYGVTTAYSFGLAAVAGAIIFLFRYPLLGIFTDEPDVVAVGAIRLEIFCVSYCLSAFMDNASAACRGLGKTLLSTVIVLAGSVGFRIVWVYTIFAHFHTLRSLYLLYGTAFVLTAIFQNIYLFSLFKKLLPKKE